MAPAAPPRTPIHPYEEYLAELDEIRRYKWIESQKADEDIGFERALVEWVSQHRNSWRDARTGKKEAKEKEKDKTSTAAK